jgi:mRNA-degrading endonuclease RelE of RelBE toxin-antitoxin system
MEQQYFVSVPNSVRKSVKKIPLPWQVRILDALTQLETKPFLGEKMSGVLADIRKIKVWPYRILYRVDQNRKFISILEIGHRGQVSYD